MASGRQTPRQRMINLMYIVFLAMIAMNVSSDVLNGFKQVEDSLTKSIKSTIDRNNKLYADFETLRESNPGKAADWYNRSASVKVMADSLYNYIEDLKYRIVREADGKDCDVNNIKKRDNLEATNFVMISPVNGEGKKLNIAIDNFRDSVNAMIAIKDHDIINGYLNTEVANEKAISGQNWASSIFENIPVSAAITVLTKLQADIRNAEGEAVSSLKQSVDEGDLRVNLINAFVIPSSRNVIRGSKYSAQIVLAAIDSTQTPDIFINGEKLNDPKGYFETVASSTGTQNIEG